MGQKKFRLTWDVRVFEDVDTEDQVKERSAILQAALKGYGMLKCDMNVLDLELAQAHVEREKRDLKKDQEEK